jgi:hypothetical protein
MPSSIRLIILALALVLPALAARPGEPAGEEPDPPNPFEKPPAERPDAVPGKLERSDGSVFRGKVYLTRDKRLELYADAEKKWHQLKLEDLAALRWEVEFEQEEAEWRWKENGSDEKVLTGRKKVDRRYRTIAKRKDGTEVRGHIRGTVIYVKPEKAEERRFFLYWNQPADFDQKPEDLVYVKEVLFGEEAAREPEKKNPSGQSDKSDRSEKAPAPEARP